MSSHTNPQITFPEDYLEARARFLDAATLCGGIVESQVHPEKGIRGEELAMDVVWIGSSHAKKVLVSLSGTHGVEGFYGSACQTEFLRRFECGSLPSDTALMFVHAVNPFGFSWSRRVDERNIDLNRNFIDHGNPPANPGYPLVHDMLLPSIWSESAEKALLAEFSLRTSQRGLREVTRAITGGQHTHPDGLFFGGNSPSWSHLALSSLVRRRLSGAETVCVLDCHTGLGPSGHTELICRHSPGSESLRLARKWWGSDVTCPAAGESASEVIGGDLRSAFPLWLAPGSKVIAILLEAGTLSAPSVLAALVADNWLWQRGEPRSKIGDEIRAKMKSAFLIETDEWATKVLDRALEVFEQALQGLKSS